MTDTTHFQKLAHMYETAPINQLIRSRIEVGEGTAVVRIDVEPTLFHAAGSLHGSMYFKGLDDAAFFAANSVVPEHFVLTAHFEVDLVAQVSGKLVVARGRLDERGERKLKASAELFDENERLVARGHGLFIVSRFSLAEVEGYRLPPSDA